MVTPTPGTRISKIDTYLNCAENFAYRSTCLKRKYGAIIVKDDAVISTGYNGSPRGFENCCDIGECPRIKRNLHQGEGYGMCRAVHAEANALLNCSREQTIPYIAPSPVPFVHALLFRQASAMFICVPARVRKTILWYPLRNWSGIRRRRKYRQLPTKLAQKYIYTCIL